MEAEDLEPDSREIELLTRAATAADRIEELEAVVRREGSTFTDKNGLVKPSPILQEIRAQDQILMQALRGIKLEARTAPAGKSERHSRAGQASWRARVARHEAKVGGI